MAISTTEQMVMLFTDPAKIHSRQFTKTHHLIIISAAIMDLISGKYVGFKTIGSKQLIVGENSEEITALNLMKMFIKTHEPTLIELLTYYSRPQHFAHLMNEVVQYSNLNKSVSIKLGGFLNNKNVYVSDSRALEEVRNHIKHLINRSGKWTDNDAALLLLYQKADLDDNLLTRIQMNELRQKLSNFQHVPENQFIVSTN